MNDTNTSQAAPLVARSAPGANPWVIAVLVAVASFMETLDTTIANVLLNYIAGGLGSARTRRPGW
jgi:MFS transporter, DHA2 family, multidrug resistance protein